jgi:hypothetical protein
MGSSDRTTLAVDHLDRLSGGRGRSKQQDGRREGRDLKA